MPNVFEDFEVDTPTAVKEPPAENVFSDFELPTVVDPAEEERQIKETLDLSEQHNIPIDKSQKLVAGPEPGLFGDMLNKVREAIRERTGYFEPPIYGPEFREEKPFRTAGKLAAFYGAESISGLSLAALDVLTNKTVGDKTLAEAVARITGFEPTSEEKQAGEAVKYIAAFTPAGIAVRAGTKIIPAAQVLKTILSSGLTFTTTDAAIQFSKTITEGKPIDWSQVHAMGGVGILWGTGEVVVKAVMSKIVKGMDKYWGEKGMDVAEKLRPPGTSLKDQYSKQQAEIRTDIKRAKEVFRKTGKMPEDLMDKYVHGKPPEGSAFKPPEVVPTKKPIQAPITKAVAPKKAEVKAPSKPLKPPVREAKVVGEPVVKPAKPTPQEIAPAEPITPVEGEVGKESIWKTETTEQAKDLGFTQSDRAVIAFIESKGGQVNISGVPLEDWYTYTTPEGLIIQSDTEIVGKGGYAELRAKADEWLTPAPQAKLPVEGEVAGTPEEELAGIRKTNPELTRQAIKAKSVEEFIDKMSKGKPETVSTEVLTDFYNRIKSLEQITPTPPTAKPVEKKPKKEAGFAEIEKTVEAMKAPAKWFLSVFEPAKITARKHGKEAVATVIRAIHKPEAKALEYGARELESLDKSYNQAEEWLSKYPRETQEAIMLTRGHGLEGKARALQKKAFASLPKELKDSKVRRALDEIADFNYEYLSEVFGEEIETLFGTDIVNVPGYVQDYFYGVYKNPNKINKFLSFWKTTDKYTKHKVFPTYADAKAYGLKIKDPNPVTNLKAEYKAISYKASMIWLKDELMRLGEGRYIMAKEEAPIDWETIGAKGYADPTFSDVLVEPDMAKLINNLISTNKISQFKPLRILRDVNNFLRTIKFVGSAFHMVQIAKQSIADSGYLGFYKPTATRGLTKGFKKDDPIFQTPEYKWYIENGGGHKYAVESQARKVFVDTLSKLTKSEQYIVKTAATPIRLPVGFVDWMFNSYIPKVKYSKYLDVVIKQEKKLDRSLTAAETQEIIKEQQNFYGMMNERLYGRSGTVTSALRFVFIAPGYAEGNYRTMLKAAFQWGQGDEGFRAGRSRVNILNSWIVTITAATIGTLILTGKPPKKPETIEEVRDLLKIDTGKKDEHGNRVMIDLATYDKDYWDVVFNTLRGRPDTAVTNAITRIGGMKAPTAKMISDLYDMMQGKTLYDWKDDKVYHITDPFLQKFGKLIAHETRELIPISASVYKQSRKRGIDRATAAIEMLLGLRTGRTERDKKEFEIVRDIWDMRDKREKLSYKINSYDDPWGAVAIYNKTLDGIVDNKFITDELREKIDSLKIDPKKVITWKRFPITKLTDQQLRISLLEHVTKKTGRAHKGWEDRVKALREEIKSRGQLD